MKVELYTGLVIGLVILFLPFYLYYYGPGALPTSALFLEIMLPFGVIAFGGATWIAFRRFEKIHMVAFLPLAIVLIGIVSTPIMIALIPTLDWKWRVDRRKEIVASINARTGYTQEHEVLGFNDFPPISNRENQVEVIHHWGNSVTIEFIIDGGLLDHYEAFVYTNNHTELMEFSRLLATDPSRIQMLERNWFRVFY
jgi:hypothetical protein